MNAEIGGHASVARGTDVSALRLSGDEAADYHDLRERAGRALALEEAVYRQHVRFAANFLPGLVDMEAAATALLAAHAGIVQ